jgi:hypothetical protein
MFAITQGTVSDGWIDILQQWCCRHFLVSHPGSVSAMWSPASRDSDRPVDSTPPITPNKVYSMNPIPKDHLPDNPSSRSLSLLSCSVVLLASITILTQAEPSVAQPARPAAHIEHSAADSATKVILTSDRQSNQYRLRAICVAKANREGIRGDMRERFVQRCVAMPSH